MDDPGLEPDIVPLQIADYANDDKVSIDRHGTIFFQIVYDLFQMFRAVDRYGHPDLRGCYHVDGCAVILERLEHFTHKTGGQQHSPAFDLDGGDMVFGGDGLDFAFLRHVRDRRTRRVGLKRVEQSHGNVILLGRQNTRLRDRKSVV